MSTIKRMHATVIGKVQGVGFRWFVQETAIKYNLAGWVKNISNGDVELEAEGEQKNLDEFLNHIRNGHPWAQVNDILIDWIKGENNYSDFEIAD